MEHGIIHDWAARRGYRVAFASAPVIGQVGDRLRRLRADGAFAPGFAEEHLGLFDGPGTRPQARTGTVVVVAVRAPAWVVRFDTEAGGVDAVLPPTYVGYQRLFETIRLDLTDALGARIGVQTLTVPLKSLAAAVGLVSYGRNNLAYVPGFGSYVQLAAYLVDVAPAGSQPETRANRMLERCVTCRACIKACPTGAVGTDRFLLRADRCYTVVSESSRPIPPETRPPSPDCLIGCLKCQEVCPENRGLLERRRSAISFSREETAALVGPGSLEKDGAGRSIEAKFGTLALTEGVPILRRNLRRLIELAQHSSDRPITSPRPASRRAAGRTRRGPAAAPDRR